MTPHVLATSIAFHSLAVLALAQAHMPVPYRIDGNPQRVASQPYERYATSDRFGRPITFYVSQSEGGALPLVVYVHGSGCASHFTRRDGRTVPQNGHATIADVARGRARVLIVEKAGVSYLDAPADAGSAQRASDEFLSEHTLDRWAEAVSSAIKAARTLPDIDPDRILVMGHSEGGLVACKVAADNTFVTHVATLSGGGPSQLFDLVELARQGHFARSASDDPELRARFILDEYAKVLSDPTSTTRQFLGHPYRRWSSFLATSPMEQLPRTNARIYIAQGAADTAVLPITARMLHAHLLARGKDVTLDFVAGADHSFSIIPPSRPGVDGWREVCARIVEWYLAEKPSK
jgi:dipeptidyl aminopeptidase/acylaminoacyl peptidase